MGRSRQRAMSGHTEFCSGKSTHSANNRTTDVTSRRYTHSVVISCNEKRVFSVGITNKQGQLLPPSERC